VDEQEVDVLRAEAVEALLDRAQHVVVSNFPLERLKRAEDLSPAPVFADQVQYHPYWLQRDLLDYCQIHDLLLTAYSPLAQGGVLDDERLARIGERHDRTPAQVALRWLVQQDNVAAIPKATSRAHLEANLKCFDFELTDEEMRAVRNPSKLRTVLGIFKGQYLRS
jgi:diketogulonate reductase-like aldo/keto reductase